MKDIRIILRQIRSVQKIFIISIVFCGLFVLGPQNVQGAWFDYHGMSGFYGDSQWTAAGPVPEDRYQWFSASYTGGKKITDWLSLESQIGVGYLDSENLDDSPSVEYRLILSFKKGYVYLNLGGGVAHLFNSDDLPNLHDTDLYGLLSGSVGLGPFYYQQGDNLVGVTLGYSTEHISDPFYDDAGCNVGAFKAKISWEF